MIRILIVFGLTLLIAATGGGCVSKKKLAYANYQRDSLQLAYDTQKLKLHYTTDARDSLQMLKDELAKEVLRLGKEKDELQEKYDQLSKASLDQAARYDKVLELKTKEIARKSEELKQKEQLLREREKKLKELQDLIDLREAAQQKLLGTLSNALSGFAKDELSVEVKDGKIFISMSDKLLFKSGSAEVDSKGKEALGKIAEALAKDSSLFIVVEGHTDTDPIHTDRFEDNWDLSAIRATAVVRLLSETYEIDPKRLTASGHGEFYPVAANSSRSNKALNRRTELVISPKLDELYNLLKE